MAKVNKIKVLNKKFDEATEKLSHYGDNPVLFIVTRKDWKLLFASLIQLGAFLKKRKSRANHIAINGFTGKKYPTLIDSTIKNGGVNYSGIKDTWFHPKFKGRVRAIVLKNNNENYSLKDHKKFIDKIMGKEYSLNGAFGSYFDFGDEQQGDYFYCVYTALKILEKTYNINDLVRGSKAEITPAELDDVLDNLWLLGDDRIIDSFDLIDTKRM